MRKLVTCLLTFLLFSASSYELSDRLRSEWEAWKNKYYRAYPTKNDEEYRFVVWTKNWFKIKQHNADNQAYTLAMNKFGDMTEEEFNDFVSPNGGCLKIHQINDPSLFAKPTLENLENIPSSVDWSNTSQYVTPVKNQGSCGSCWAFSATGATESRYAIATGVLNSLSEQELVDCSDLYGNAGCGGGYMDSAFAYIKANDGLSLESQYAYTGKDGTCQKSNYKHYDPINGFKLVQHENETALMVAVVAGPVSVGVQANQMSFQFYSGGILNGNCGTNIDHGVLVVGYGEENANSKYWVVKNSWGTDWGENGYVRICRDCGKNNGKGECCINCEPSYPTI